MKICVVGCERSGTTVISSLLSKGSGLSYLNDPPDSWYIYPLVSLIGIRGFTFDLILRLWKHDIVKIPGFATILPELKKVHPKNFKVVYVVRDPRDILSAIKERLEEDFNGLYLNIHFLNLRGNSICENIGLRWATYLEKAKLFEKKNPANIMFVKYEDFLDNKINVLQSIAKFASLDLNIPLIKDQMNFQVNKSWSNKMGGAGRYLNDLSKNEVGVINEIASNGIKEFKY